MTIENNDASPEVLRNLTADLPASGMTGVPADGAGLTGSFYVSSGSLYSIAILEDLIEDRELAGGPDGAFVTEDIEFAGGVTIADFLGDGVSLAPGSEAAANASMDKVGLALNGFVYIPEGRHEITVRSDDGFKLSLGGEVYSAYTGQRGHGETTVAANFEAGLYEIDLLYFENYGSQSLSLEIDGAVVSDSAFYDSIAAFEAAVDAPGAELTAIEDYHPSTVFGATAAAPEPAIAIADLGDVPLVGTGLSGAVYHEDWVRSIDELARLIGAGGEPTATFTASEVAYGGGWSQQTLDEFLRGDAESLSDDVEFEVDGTGFVFEGFVVLPAGEHALTVRSDDSFALFLGGAEVARRDAYKNVTETTVEDTFEGGLYKIKFVYFDVASSQAVSLEIDGLPIDGSAFYASVADFQAQQAAADVDSIPAADYHPGLTLGLEAYGDAIVAAGDPAPQRLVGKGGDDLIAGGDQVDHITGGYGDDRLEGGAGNDVLDGGRGSDLLIGGAGDDLLIARSDAGEQRIGQLAINRVTRGDPDGEVNDDRQKLAGWEDQPLKADDILVGGEGRDVFLIAPQINAKQEIIQKHVRADGSIDWKRIAGENNELHDHWVDGAGIDVIADYKAGEDKIAIIGHTVNPQIQARRDVDGDGDLETIITITSKQMGAGGAHDQDLISQLIVHGDAVELDDIRIDAGVTYGIVENYVDVAEALYPAGEAKATVTIAQPGGFVDAGTGSQDASNARIEAAYDTRTFNRSSGEVDLGAVTGTPEDHIDNPYLALLADLDASPSAPGYMNSRAPFEPRPIVEDAVEANPDDLPGAVGFWRFDDIADGVGADARGGPDVVAYRLYENQAAPRLSGAQADGPKDQDGGAIAGASTGALEFDGKHDFAVIAHDGAHQFSQGTIALWVRPEDLGDDEIIVSKDLRNSGEGGHFRLGHRDDGRIHLRMAEGDGDGNKAWTSSASYLDEGEWTHLAVSFTDEGVTVYVDGRSVPDFGWQREEGNVDIPGDYTEAYLIQNQEPWVLGADTSGTKISGSAAAFAVDARNLDDAFEGAIADFGIWGGFEPGAALNRDQVQELFEAGPGPNLDAPPAPPHGVLDGASQTVAAGAGNDLIDGRAGDDDLDGGDGHDDINGGYGDDRLTGGAGDDVLDGGRGSDLLQGGDGDDILISRSDAGEQRIGQLANGDPSRDDPDMEVNPAFQKLYGWEDQPLVADDILIGGAGRDTFYFNPLINAKLDIIMEHVEDNRWINWAGVAGENNELHDHWVDNFGIDVIGDYDADEDEIVIVGHTVAPEVSYKVIDSDLDGRPDELISIITVYSNQMGGGGAHDQDLIGQIVVHGDAVDRGAIHRTAGVTHGIVETIDDIVEAVAPTPGAAGTKNTGTIFQTDPLTGDLVEVTVGYDSRSYRIGANGEVVVENGHVIDNPDAYVENPFEDQVTYAQAFDGRDVPQIVLETGPLVFDDATPYHVNQQAAGLAQASGTVLVTFTANSPGDGYQALWSQDANGYGDGGHHTAWIDSSGRIKVRYQSEERSEYLEAREMKIEAGEIYTVAFTFDDEGAKLYVNGALQDVDDAVPVIGNDESLVLGASTIYRTPGMLNELRDFFDGAFHNFIIADEPFSLADLIVLENDFDDLPRDDVMAGEAAAQLLAGDVGMDTVSYASSDAGVMVNLGQGKAAGGDAAGDSLTSIENLIGSAFNDILIGDDGVNSLDGGDGVDRLDGRGGDDVMIGGAGNDIFTVREVGDQVVEFAGGGTDRVNTYVDYVNPDNVELLVGKFAATGLNLTGNDTRDQIAGSSKIHSPDTISGLGGDDMLVGLVGDDILHGGAGRDRLFGNSGDDTLTGAAGADVLVGQQGADTFVFGPGSGIDTVKDFTAGVDKIDLVAYGFADFAAVAAVLEDANGRAQLNLDGNADVVRLNGVQADDLEASDFILVA